MKKQLVSFLTVLLILLLTQPLAAQSSGGVRFRFNPEKKFKVIIRADYRHSIDGAYKGLLARETRCLYEREDYPLNTGGFRVNGRVFVLEDLYRSGLGSARVLDNTHEVSFVLHNDGRYTFPPAASTQNGSSAFSLLSSSASADNLYPLERSFPLFSADPVAVGESWIAESEKILISPETGNTTRVPLLCEYTLKGPAEYGGQPAWIIEAQYAVRYQRGQDPHGDPNLSQVSGSHKMLIYANEEGPLFIRDNMFETMMFTDGGSFETKGFILTFFKGIPPMNRDRVVRDVRTQIEEGMRREGLSEEEKESLTVSEKPEGVAVNMSDLHFVADEAQLLPGESDKLDTMARILKGIEGERTFLVVGHTAPFGTEEGRQILSEERAKTIVDEMVKRGLPAGRFLYEGRGAREQIAPNDTPENRSKNRRVEIIIMED